MRGMTEIRLVEEGLKDDEDSNFFFFFVYCVEHDGSFTNKLQSMYTRQRYSTGMIMKDQRGSRGIISV
jgi:hypothetical protein